MTTTELLEVGSLMQDGLARVQQEVGPRAPQITLGQNSNLDLGITQLDTFRDTLGAGIGIHAASKICELSQNPNLQEWFSYPVQLLVDNPLQVIATSEGLPMEQRLTLVDRWIQAVSSGPGHYYPGKWVARFSVASTVQSVSLQAFSIGRDLAGKPINAAESIVDTFDFSIPVLGPALKRLATFAKSQTYRATTSLQTPVD